METNPNIKEQVNKALESVKNVQSIELPYDFADRVVSNLHTKENNATSLYTLSPLLKVAAVVILIIVNMFTLRLALSPQAAQSPAKYVTIKDFVNGYQINDTNEELITLNTQAHE